MKMWGVHATITTRTEKFLSIKAYELDVGIQYFPFITCYFEMLCFNIIQILVVEKPLL